MLFGVTYPLYRWRLRFPSTGTVQASKTDYSRFICSITLVSLNFIYCVDTVSFVVYMCTPNILSLLKRNSPCFCSVSDSVTSVVLQIMHVPLLWCAIYYHTYCTHDCLQFVYL